MNHRRPAYLILLATAVSAGVALAQPGVSAPQRGVHVQLAVTSHSVAVPSADGPEALVVALTADGTIYLRGDPVAAAALANRVRSVLATRTDKTLYIKADARLPYARLVEVIDAVQHTGVDRVTLLTAQQESQRQGTSQVSPQGLELRIR